jgi:hypothetical protein
MAPKIGTDEAKLSLHLISKVASVLSAFGHDFETDMLTNFLSPLKCLLCTPTGKYFVIQRSHLNFI